MIIRIEAISDVPSGMCFIFKHSSACSVSAAAKKEVEHYAQTRENVSIVQIIVQEQRELSNQVAALFGVQHESPQVLLVRDGLLVDSVSRWQVTAEWMEKITTLKGQ